MRRTLVSICLSALALGACATPATDVAPEAVNVAPAQAAPAAASPLAALVQQVDIPYDTFTLDNGLRVVVHEDRKAPVVAVSVWYNVGSKDEPAGKTGFAHLFEHMMFYGSENAPGGAFPRLEAMGATDWNGTTWYDRTNYFETVPTAALETALFLESDRMGHLLGAVTQEKLKNQIGVVQNEKRESDNEPYGLVNYAKLEALFPEGHPYRHDTIGSMADLSAASLEDVHQWFRSKYGPNNAVLVLAGDIDVPTARTLTNKYFGDIPAGPVNNPAQASVPTLPARVDQVMRDRVATTRLYRSWVVPGVAGEDLVPLDIAASVLGGLSSSRLDNILVREEQSAVRVSANLQPFHRVGFFDVEVDVKPGVDADQVARRLDQIINDYIASGPTADEVQRVAMSTVAARIRGLEQVGGFGGKAVTLAEGQLYNDDPSFYKRELSAYAAATPEQVRAAMQKWLTRPVYALRVVPGEREAYQEVAGSGGSTHRPRYFRTPGAGDQPLAPAPAASAQVDRSRIPEVGTIGDLQFPQVERARLSNGIEVTFARRSTVPVVRMSMQFNAGYSADPRERLGLQSFMTGLMDEGTTSRNSTQLAEEEERLGAAISTGATLDRTTVSLAALKSTLPQSLDLMADIIKNPAFDPEEIERLRGQRLAGIASELTQPNGIASRTLPPLLYGAQHPYGVPFTGSGTVDTVKAITRDDIVAAHQSWIRPDNAQIFVVGDTSLAEMMPLLEQRFGQWQAPAAPRGTKAFTAVPQPKGQRIVLVDRPQSPQSLILGAYVMPLKGTQDMFALEAANSALGGMTSARINMDLRETKGWAYGAYSYPNKVEHEVPFFVQAPVQTDKTADSIRALQGQLTNFLGKNGVTSEELSKVVDSGVRGLPGSFETSAAVLNAIQQNALYRRPDNYQSTLASRYRALTPAELDRAARAAIDPGKITWVVVGDAAKVRPQLEKLGLPIEVQTLK